MMASNAGGPSAWHGGHEFALEEGRSTNPEPRGLHPVQDRQEADHCLLLPPLEALAPLEGGHLLLQRPRSHLSLSLDLALDRLGGAFMM